MKHAFPSTSADQIAQELLSALEVRRQIPSLSARLAGFDLHAAYEVTAAIQRRRETRGERIIGRKIGFTNRTIWPEYDVYAPIWGYVYDTTVQDLSECGGFCELQSFVEPRIEPEIVFGLRAAPRAGMDNGPCCPASTGWRTASRSSSPCLQTGSSLRPIPLPPSGCTGPA
jgi:2-oxo-3-hexenedioate decarboxylase